MARNGERFCEKICRVLRGVYVAEDMVPLFSFIVRVVILYRNVFRLLFGNSSGDKLERP